jgi:signal transduction histidine kinase
MSLFKEIYLYASQASVLLPVIVGIRYYKLLTKPFKFMFWFFVLATLTEIQAEIVRWVYGNNLPGLHVYTVIEFFAFSMLFFWQIQTRGMKLLILLNLLISITVAGTDAWMHGLKVPNELSRGFTALSMMAYALAYLYYLFTIDDTRYMKEYPMFWICIGMLVYFAGNALYFATKTHLIHENKNIAWGFHMAHAAFNIIAYCLYAQSFKCLGKQKIMA